MIDIDKMFRTLDGAQSITRTIADATDEKVKKPLEESLRILLETATGLIKPEPDFDDED